MIEPLKKFFLKSCLFFSELELRLTLFPPLIILPGNSDPTLKTDTEMSTLNYSTLTYPTHASVNHYKAAVPVLRTPREQKES